MAIALFLAALMMLVMAILCLLIIMFKRRAWSLQKVWSLASQGDRLAQLYVVLIGSAFAFAVIAQLALLLK